jgi:hypothetical protein
MLESENLNADLKRRFANDNSNGNVTSINQ